MLQIKYEFCAQTKYFLFDPDESMTVDAEMLVTAKFALHQMSFHILSSYFRWLCRPVFKFDLKNKLIQKISHFTVLT